MDDDDDEPSESVLARFSRAAVLSFAGSSGGGGSSSMVLGRGIGKAANWSPSGVILPDFKCWADNKKDRTWTGTGSAASLHL